MRGIKGIFCSLFYNRPSLDETFFCSYSFLPAVKEFGFELSKFRFFEFLLCDFLDNVIRTSFGNSKPNEIFHNKFLINHSVITLNKKVIEFLYTGCVWLSINEVLQQTRTTRTDNCNECRHFRYSFRTICCN